LRSKAAEPRQTLPRIVKQLGAVSFFNDLASEMVYPLLPALITTRLGGTAVALGTLDGVAEAVAAVVKYRAGWLAERIRLRRPLVIVGYGLAAVARPVMAVAGAPWQIVALRGADRLGKGARTPPRDAIIADATAPAVRGRAFGFHRAMDHAGAAIGPVLAWLLLSAGSVGLERVVLWSAVPGIVTVGVVVWSLRRIGPGLESSVPQGTAGAMSAEHEDSGGGVARGLFYAIVAFAFVRMPETLILLRLQDSGLAIALIPLAWAALHVVRTVSSYPGGALSDRIGPRLTMTLGWVIYGAVCLGLAHARGAVAAVAWFLPLGLVSAATESPERAFIAAAGRRARSGRRFGAYHASVGLAALPGSVLLGVVYARLGGATALVMSGALGLALAAGGLILHSRPARA
jgi:MFS family permease